MQNNGMSARNIACLIVLMTLCSLLITGFGTIGQDMWIAVGAAAMMAIPLVLVYSRIASINPGLDLFTIIDRNFGRVVGSIFMTLLSWYALHISALVTRNFSEFVVSISLESTPKVFIIIGMIAVGGYLAGTSYNVMGRWSLIVFIVVVTNLVLTFLLATPSIDLSNLKPVMEYSIAEIFSASFSFGSIAFAETVLALVAFGSMKSKDSPYKAYLLGLGLGAIMVLSVILRNITVLGREMVATSVFPSYITIRIINPGSFIEHIESIVSFNLILMGITKVSICIRAASMGVAKLLRTEDAARKYIVPVCLLSISVCLTTFSNIQELIAFVKAYRYYALPFTILIPVIIWIKSEIGKKTKRGAPDHTTGQ